MQIIRKKDTNVRTLKKEVRRYYLPESTPLELIETVIEKEVSQMSHLHSEIDEAIYIIEGKIKVTEFYGEKKDDDILSVGDFVVFQKGSCHQISNHTKEQAIFSN